jgi:hypothetical protein
MHTIALARAGAGFDSMRRNLFRWYWWAEVK